MSSRPRNSLYARLVAAALGATALLGCEQQVEVHGNMPDPEVLAEIEPGVHSRADVEQILGTPSTVATFDDETWYYIGGRIKRVSFFDPELLGRKVVTIQFNKDGVVRDVSNHTAESYEEVDIVQRETPTRGKELTILEQLIGNVGKFTDPNADSGDSILGP